MIVYMAAPIDFNKGSDVNEHKVQIKKYFSKVEGAWVYDPSKAWTAPADLDPDEFVHWANLHVLEQADLLVAVLVKGVLTVGTILEIQHAHDCEIPVVVVGDVGENSVGLKALDIPVFENIGDASEAWLVEIMQDRKEHSEQSAFQKAYINRTFTY